MDNKKSEVEKALEDLFDEPFLTIEEEKKIKENNNATSYDDKYEDGDDNTMHTYEDYEEKQEDVLENDDIKNKEETIANNDVDDDRIVFSNPKVVEEDKKESNKYIFYMILALVFMFSVVTCVVIYITNKEQVTRCTFKAFDSGYKIKDEYTIAHKNGNLTYVQGKYKYTALTDEFKAELENVKKEKIPVIVNSNGMPGFTHSIQTTDEYVMVDSYYDITKINFKEVDKIDYDVAPVSYITLKSTTTYKKIINELNKKAYICKKLN